ncbi:MAG: response regulator [Chloroflexi bacterium]|nr:response regulator [Chloroflexota bacterium]
MTEPRALKVPLALTDQILDLVVEQTRDQQHLLADIAARVQPYSDELIAVWTRVYREAKVREPLPPEDVIRGIQEAAVDLFFGGLRSADLSAYYASFIDWGKQIAQSGLAYDRLVQLVRAYQKSGLPFLARAYAPGPALEMALHALDLLYNGTIQILAAAYIQVAHEQLISSTRIRAVGQLAIGATHSLNNAFAGVLGRAQLLAERVHEEDWRSELQEIQRTAAGGAQTVRRLQEFARTSREEKFAPTDLNQLLREAAEITRFYWRDQAESNGVVIDVVKDFADVPPVLAHPSELREVFIELILNAIEAMPRGGLITLSTARKAGQLIVAVTDTGDGMPEALRRRVFDPFFTTKGAGHAGLGLSVAARVIGQHNGAFEVASTSGRGTTFTLALPLEAGGSEAPAKATLPPTQAANILIIDDEPTIRDVVAKFLAFRGHRVIVAGGGAEGVARFKENAFDLVVTDLGMPGMSGWDVAREIKKVKPKVLVVLMTGWSADLDSRKVKESGVDRVVHKPFQVDDVLDLIGEAVALREKM